MARRNILLVEVIRTVVHRLKTDNFFIAKFWLKGSNRLIPDGILPQATMKMKGSGSSLESFYIYVVWGSKST